MPAIVPRTKKPATRADTRPTSVGDLSHFEGLWVYGKNAVASEARLRGLRTPNLHLAIGELVGGNRHRPPLGVVCNYYKLWFRADSHWCLLAINQSLMV